MGIPIVPSAAGSLPASSPSGKGVRGARPPPAHSAGARVLRGVEGGAEPPLARCPMFYIG